MNEYLTAAAIVAVVIAVAIVGGRVLLSKMSFARQRQTLPTIVGMNSDLFVLLSEYRKWKVADATNRKLIKKYYPYFDHGLDQFFCLTIKANERGMTVLKSHKT